MACYRSSAKFDGRHTVGPWILQLYSRAAGRIEAVSRVESSVLAAEASVPRPRREELPMGPEEARGPDAENGGPGGQFWGKLRIGLGATAGVR